MYKTNVVYTLSLVQHVKTSNQFDSYKCITIGMLLWFSLLIIEVKFFLPWLHKSVSLLHASFITFCLFVALLSITAAPPLRTTVQGSKCWHQLLAIVLFKYSYHALYVCTHDMLGCTHAHPTI